MKEPLVVNNLEGKWFENTYKLCEVTGGKQRARELCGSMESGCLP